jgi:aspartate oxidase
MEKKVFKEHFPNIYEKYVYLSVSTVSQKHDPVAPAGLTVAAVLTTDEWGHRSIRGLYDSGGDAAARALHGANRLDK